MNAIRPHLFLHAAKKESAWFFALTLKRELVDVAGTPSEGDPSVRLNGYLLYDLAFAWIARFAYFAGRDTLGIFRGHFVLHRKIDSLPTFHLGEQKEANDEIAWISPSDRQTMCYPKTLLNFCAGYLPQLGAGKVVFDLHRIVPTMGWLGWTIETEADIAATAQQISASLMLDLVWDSSELATFISGVSVESYDW